MIFGLTFFIMNLTNAQDLSAHQWKDRLLLIKINEPNNAIYKEQIKELEKNLLGLAERKIIVYHIKKDEFIKGLSNKKSWNTIKIKNKKYFLKVSNPEFEIFLIGLDGQVKLKQTELLKSKELFSKIDLMPMRMQEMNKSN